MGSLSGRDHVRANHGIECGTGIDCGKHLETGWGIKAGTHITANGAIKVGESLHAGGAIRSGDRHAIYAGLAVQLDAWDVSAQVCASTKPARLLSGWWNGA